MFFEILDIEAVSVSNFNSCVNIIRSFFFVDELYTQIEAPTGIVSGHYDDLRCSQRQVNANPQPNKGTEEDDRRSDHNYDYLSIPSTLTK